MFGVDVDCCNGFLLYCCTCIAKIKGLARKELHENAMANRYHLLSSHRSTRFWESIDVSILVTRNVQFLSPTYSISHAQQQEATSSSIYELFVNVQAHRNLAFHFHGQFLCSQPSTSRGNLTSPHSKATGLTSKEDC